MNTGLISDGKIHLKLIDLLKKEFKVLLLIVCIVKKSVVFNVVGNAEALDVSRPTN